MFVAEFRVRHECSPLVELTEKYDAWFTVYFLNAFARKNKLALSKVLSVQGPQSTEFIAELSKRNIGMEISHVEGSQLFYVVNAPASSYVTLLLDKDLFLLKPVFVKKGFEYWSVASWSKAKLNGIIKKSRTIGTRAKIKALSIKEDTVELFVSAAFSSLTKNQLVAFTTAVKNGYYSYPRKVNLNILAQLLKQPKATIREHLRKAEQKLMPAVFQQAGAFTR